MEGKTYEQWAASAGLSPSTGGHATPTPTPSSGGNPGTPWVTYTGTAGVTSYRAAGTVPGIGYGYIEYLPAGFNAAPDNSYPLVIFLSGIGERGDGSVAALTNFRNNTWNAAGVQYNIDHGKYYNAVVLTPQCPTTNWWNTAEVDKVVVYAMAHYKINPKRILVTGLSMGGGGTWDYVGAQANKIAAAIPIAGATDCQWNNAKSLVPAGVKVWSFHALDDDICPYGNSVSCMTQVGSMVGQVGNFMDGYNSNDSSDQTAHFNNSTKRWVFEPQFDCEDSANHPWPMSVCQTLFKSGKHGIWGRVYQHPTDLPMIWLLNQSRP